MIFLGVLGVMVTGVENGHGDPSLNLRLGYISNSANTRGER